MNTSALHAFIFQQWLLKRQAHIAKEQGTYVVRDIGRRLTEATGDQHVTFWFIQRLSLAVQRGNTASILCGERETQRYFES